MAEPAAPEITGNVLFYNTPEPLNSERHAKLGLKNVGKPFGFAKTGHVVPVTLGEFGLAAMSYPIIFAGPEQTPLAVMGLKAYLLEPQVPEARMRSTLRSRGAVHRCCWIAS